MEAPREGGKIEGVPIPETTAEQPEVGRETEPALDRPAEKEPAASAGAPAPVRDAFPEPAKAAPLTKDALHMSVERVLEDNLRDVYFSLPPDKRAAFRTKGEEAATKIRALMERGKATAGKILRLIRGWLKTIPGVNRYFLEQEAKIKTDKMIALAKEKEAGS